MFDLLLKNGLVLDGSGKEGYLADLAIQDGKIAAIGKDLGESSQVLDVTGLVVSPGWIDSHSHSDNAFLTYPDMVEKVEQGITMSISGQCGGSAAPKKELSTSELFTQLETLPQGSGAVMLIGHNNLRNQVIGKENRDPSEEELERMKQLLAEGMDAGAAGMSFGLYYVPGCYSKTPESVALAKVVAEKGGYLAAHIRNEGDQLLESVDEYLEIIRESGCRAVFSHHKSARQANWGKVRKSLQMIDEANAAGADVYLDVYPYIASHTSLSSFFIPSRFHPPGTKNVGDLLNDPKLCEAIKDDLRSLYGDDLSWILVTRCPKIREMEGMRVSQIAEYFGMEDQYEAAHHVLRLTDCDMSGCYFSMCEEDLEYVIAHPRAMICTDSSVARGANKYHPRLRAAFPRAIGRYVREKQVVSLPEMIRKMTSLPAHVYGLTHKGLLAEGYDADICIFDPETIGETSDFVNCSLPNVGLTYVIINGKVVAKDGVYNGTRAAKVYKKWEV